jgi:hypothetical protein
MTNPGAFEEDCRSNIRRMLSRCRSIQSVEVKMTVIFRALQLASLLVLIASGFFIVPIMEMWP